jgi:nucleoside-diphosphate-sugar epimerase
MTALVTGGGGFLGLAVVRALLKRGALVRSFSRQPHRELGDLAVKQHCGDLADANAVSAAVAGCDIVFHIAAKAGIWGPYDEYFQANVAGTANILAACRKHGISRLVYTSSPSVVFNGLDMEGVDESAPYPTHYEAHYPRTKAMAERLVLEANDGQLATISLRPHLIWGPGDKHLQPRLAARARSGQLRRIGVQARRIDTIYIDNAADAHLLAADRLSPGSPVAGKVYFISQDDPIEIWEMVNRLLKASGVSPVSRSISIGAALTLAWCFESWHRLTGNRSEPRLTRFVVRELSTAHWFNIDAAKRDLGYAPKVSIDEGMKRLEDYLRRGS